MRGAAIALELLTSPGRLLSAVQVGITFVGLLAGAFGGATLAQRLAAILGDLGFQPEAAQLLAVGAVVVAIGYASLILGELVPKQLALARPERIAVRVAGPMWWLARSAAPLVALLEASSRLVLRILGPQGRPVEAPSEAEIRALVAEAESAGVVEPEEKAMIGRVMRLGDLSVRAIMTPRHELDWLDLDRPSEELLERLLASPHSRLPAGRGRVDEVTGVIQVKDVLDQLARGKPLDFAALLRTPPALHEGADVLAALAALATSPVDMAFVVDEYGTLEGVVTSSDVLGAIVGELPMPEGGESRMRFCAKTARGFSMGPRASTPPPSSSPSSCRPSATTTPLPVSCSISFVGCRAPATTSCSRAGALKWWTWTGGGSTRCSRAR